MKCNLVFDKWFRREMAFGIMAQTAFKMPEDETGRRQTLIHLWESEHLKIPDKYQSVRITEDDLLSKEFIYIVQMLCC